MKQSRSFTLIELLVVISIIGLLSSIVLVSMKGTREKARIAKGLEFSQSVNNALGADAVGIWRFEEGVGSTVYDYSGYGNNGTINGGANYTTGILGKALSFDGVDDYVNAGSGASLKMGTGAITVEQWINPPTWTGYKSLFYGSAGGGNQGYGTGLDTGGTGFFYEVYGATGGRQRFTMDIGIQKNQWNHIVAVFDGVNNKMIAYLNGVQKDTRNISDPGDVPTNNGFIIGSHGGSNWFFNGLIDDFRIYNQALSAFEIQKHYAEGLGKHDNLAVK